MRTVALILAAVTLATAQDTSKSGAGLDPATKSALLLASSLPSTLAEGFTTSRETLVHAIYGATQLAGTGQVVGTGTLDRTPTGSWRYAAEPRDKLVVKLAQVTHEFVLKDAQGDAQAATAEAFIAANHYLHYLHRVEGVAAVEMKLRHADGQFVAEAAGEATHDGTTYRVKLRSAGSHFHEGDLSGTATRTRYTLAGEIVRAGFHLTVSEGHSFELVTAGKHSASDSTDTCASVLQLGDDQYEWKDVSVRKVFSTRNRLRAMRPADSEKKWKIQGRILKNGEKFGVYHIGVAKAGVDARRQYHGLVQVRLKTAGETLIIQSFTG